MGKEVYSKPVGLRKIIRREAGRHLTAAASLQSGLSLVSKHGSLEVS